VPRRTLNLKDLLTRGSMIKPSELAQAMNVSEAAVYAWCARRTIPFLEFGKSKRFLCEDIEAWILDNRRGLKKPPDAGHSAKTGTLLLEER